MELKKKKILLGTINYNQVSVVHWLPYAVGCLISHCKKNPKINELYEFMEPIYMSHQPRFYDKVLKQADILGLTNYGWNITYNDKLARHYKAVNPKGFVIYGGPEVPWNQEERKLFMEEHPWVDHSIAGLGEIAFEEWLLDLPASGKKITEVPTVYTDGIFDSIIKRKGKGHKLGAAMESDRGCPYGCAFCDWGNTTRSKITKFDFDTVMKQFEFIYATPEVDEFFLANANLGILERDVAMVEGWLELQEKYDHPINVVYGGLAKNGSKHLPRIVDLLENKFNVQKHNMKVSFQTHTPEVLRIINRGNINNSKLLPIIEEQRAKGNDITGEMIIGLPGETAESWLDSHDYMFHDLGINRTMIFILQITQNTMLADKAFQKEYGIKTKRVHYGSHSQHVMYECFSYDLEELVRMYDYNWLWHNLINTGFVTNQVDSLGDQFRILMKKINDGQAPFLKSLIDRNRTIVREVFRPERRTELKSSDYKVWFQATLRSGELRDIFSNRDLFQREISVVFPKPLELEWDIDSYFKRIPDIK